MQTIFVSPDFPLNRRMRKAVKRGKLEVIREGGERLTTGRTAALDMVPIFSSPLVCMVDNGADNGGMGGENGDVTRNFNPQQIAAVEHSGSHVLVLAGAGTGKTATIIGRTAHLLKQGVESRRILLITFTRRAANEMIHRLGRATGNEENNGGPKVQAGTFHHFCLRTMQSMPDDFGLRNITVMDRDDQLQLVRLIRAPFRRAGENFARASKIMNAISYARNINKPLNVYLGGNADLWGWEDDIVERVLQIADKYHKRKEERGYLDFDDLLHRFAVRLQESEQLRNRVKRRYDHILVDEMQDTNPLQWLTLDALRDPPLLFCVGDDAQSIYAFRGADFQNVHSFTKRVPGAKILKLEENYRSTQEILNLANWLLIQSPLKYKKRLRAARGTESNVQPVSRLTSWVPDFFRKNIVMEKDSPGGLPRLLDFYDEFDEAAWITCDLIERHERNVPWRDHMIIIRTAYAARTLEAEMIQAKVPYKFIGGTQLFQVAHVKDLLSLVRAGLSHRDELAWMRYLTLWPGIGDVGAARIIEKLLTHPDAEKALGALRKKWTRDKKILQGLDMILFHKGPPAEIIRSATNFLGDLLSQRHENWKRRKRDLDLLARLAARHRSIQAFLEAYALDPMSSTEASRLEQDDTVTLITAHSAKGTEAPVCYLLRAERGMYPHARSLGDKDEEEEERRVLYVAITRAQNELIMTRSMSAQGERYRGDAAVSGYFLEDVPEKLVDRETIYSENIVCPYRRR